MLDKVNTTLDLQDKKVIVLSKGKELHRGVVLGEDRVFEDTIFVGLTSTTIPGVAKPTGQKYISIFRASRKQLKVI